MDPNHPDEMEHDPLPAKALALVEEIKALLKDRQLGKAQRLYFQKMPGLSASGRKTVDAALREKLEIDFLPDEIVALLKGTRNVINRDTGLEIDEDIDPLD